MTTGNQLHEQLFTAALVKRMVTGAAIGLVFISVYLAGVDNTDPEWPKYWMARPLIVVLIAGAIGGAFYDFMHLLRHQGGLKKLLGLILGLVGFIVILWLGSVYGLDGSLWD